VDGRYDDYWWLVDDHDPAFLQDAGLSAKALSGKGANDALVNHGKKGQRRGRRVRAHPARDEKQAFSTTASKSVIFRIYYNHFSKLGL